MSTNTCTDHPLRCKFGRPHTWMTWYENGKLVETAQTLHCLDCGSVCHAEESRPSQYTQLKLKPEYRDKLKELADAEKRSMAKQLEMIIEREWLLRYAQQSRELDARWGDGQPG